MNNLTVRGESGTKISPRKQTTAINECSSTILLLTNSFFVKQRIFFLSLLQCLKMANLLV
ncbi:Uncharacterised protein [Vibrio cholerae]|nr:Uncharacterised protein [Vibrio cholerae]